MTNISDKVRTALNLLKDGRIDGAIKQIQEFEPSQCLSTIEFLVCNAGGIRVTNLARIRDWASIVGFLSTESERCPCSKKLHEGVAYRDHWGGNLVNALPSMGKFDVGWTYGHIELNSNDQPWAYWHYIYTFEDL